MNFTKRSISQISSCRSYVSVNLSLEFIRKGIDINLSQSFIIQAIQHVIFVRYLFEMEIEIFPFQGTTLHFKVFLSGLFINQLEISNEFFEDNSENVRSTGTLNQLELSIFAKRLIPVSKGTSEKRSEFSENILERSV
ncbi:hypothetical protein ACOSQ4_009456 [Xanthoceras sorbifolium]